MWIYFYADDMFVCLFSVCFEKFKDFLCSSAIVYILTKDHFRASSLLKSVCAQQQNDPEKRAEALGKLPLVIVLLQSIFFSYLPLSLYYYSDENTPLNTFNVHVECLKLCIHDFCITRERCPCKIYQKCLPFRNYVNITSSVLVFIMFRI